MQSVGIFQVFSFKIFRAELSSSSESVGSLFFTARDSIIAPTKPLNSARYERGSILLTSNKSYGDWGSIFGDSIIATAILDRLLHHSTTINIRGESSRLKERRKAGLVPAREQERAASNSLASDSVAPKTRQKTALGSTASEAKEAAL